jgi:replicative DNA helicase
MNELPKDLNSECCLIAGMCRSETIFYNAVSKLHEHHFYDESNKIVFEELKKHTKPDLIILDHICKNIDVKLFDSFAEAYGSYNGNSEIEYIIEAYKRRKIIIAAQQATQSAMSDNDKTPDNISSQLISDMNSIEINDDMVHVKDLIPGVIDYMESVTKNGTASYIKTGLPAIDEKLIITQTDYIILGGRSSNGKSAMAGAIARNVVKAGKRVLYFCLDTIKEVEILRTLFSDAHCDLYSFNKGLTTKKDYIRLHDTISTFPNYELYMSSNDVTVEQLIAKANRLKHEKGDIDLVVIDYITRIRCNKHHTLRENVNHISRELHELPKIIKCPVLALSQLSRYENEEIVPPKRKNLKESGNLEQDADILMFVHWPGNYSTFNAKKAGCSSDYFKLYVAKQKNGSVGLIELSIDKTTLNFSKYNRIKTDTAEGWQDDY